MGFNYLDKEILKQAFLRSLLLETLQDCPIFKKTSYQCWVPNPANLARYVPKVLGETF